jgi:hypothetical protein
LNPKSLIPGLVHNTVLTIEPKEQFSVGLRAVNAIGSGEWVNRVLENTIPEKLKRKLEGGKSIFDEQMPTLPTLQEQMGEEEGGKEEL